MNESAKSFRYRHIVTFADTNALGNVYYTQHLAWQGRCREIFLAEKAPSLLSQIGVALHLVTLKVSCEFYHELHAFDEVQLNMRLAHLHQHRIGLDFEYELAKAGARRLVARGFQEIGCMAKTQEGLLPVPPPPELLEALRPFQVTARG